jgi:hypothetical protein
MLITSGGAVFTSGTSYDTIAKYCQAKSALRAKIIVICEAICKGFDADFTRRGCPRENFENRLSLGFRQADLTGDFCTR